RLPGRYPALPHPDHVVLPSRSGAGELRLDLEDDLLADQHATGHERGVPRQPPVFAVDLGSCTDAGHLGTPRVRTDTLERRGQLDRAGDAADGQVTDHDELRTSDVPDLGRPERDLGVVLDVEEVGGP